jgi:phosphatidylinositol alpha-1,6-mannosyltransferase
MSVQTPAHVVGGMAEHTVLLTRLLARCGHEVTLLTTRHPHGRAGERADGVDIHYLTGTRPGSQRGGWWRESLRAFSARHTARPFDVVISQSSAAAAIVRRMPRESRPPLVTISHGTSPQMMRSLLNAARRRGGGLRSLGWTTRKLASYGVGFWWTERPVYTRADAVIVLSDLVAASVRRWFPAASERLRVVPYAIDTELFAPNPERRRLTRARLGVADADGVVVSVGVLSAQKGIDVAIEALALARARLPGLRLVVVGDGDAAADLRRIAERRGVADAVRFTGRVPHRATADYYNAADVFVMPTLRVESFGLVLAEAMACEVPVVASRIGATHEVVADGETGVLVAPGRADALAEAIVAVVGDRDRARAFGRAGRVRALARWDPQAHVGAVLDVVAEIMRRR